LPPSQAQAHESYFVVARLNYVVAGAFAFPMLAALYYWLPLLTGRTTVYRTSVPAFWLVFVGFNLTFFMMHLTGLLGIGPRPERGRNHVGGSAGLVSGALIPAGAIFGLRLVANVGRRDRLEIIAKLATVLEGRAGRAAEGISAEGRPRAG
jgi:heme/copper-type cytochrome/quinol oxidase subunit 1